jgi:hypothetical protein
VVDKVEFFESLRYVSPRVGLSDRTGLAQSPVTSGHAYGIHRLNGIYILVLSGGRMVHEAQGAHALKPTIDHRGNRLTGTTTLHELPAEEKIKKPTT